MDWYELAIIAFILVGIGYVVFRSGTANPESTGALGRKVNALRAEVSGLSTRMDSLGSEFAKLERESVSTKDIAQLEALVDERLNTLRAEMASHQELSKSTNRNVQRIYDIMLEKGLGSR